MTGSTIKKPSIQTERLGSTEDLAAVFAAVVDSALDSVIVVDEGGRVVAMNPAAETTFGYSLDEAFGHSIGELIVPENLRDAHEKGMARYRATREPRVLGRRVELEACCKDGRIVPVELAITEVSLPGRRLFTANLRDLSKARESAAEIERQRDALHQSEKLAALGSLLAGVAHELNNPLSIVLGQSIMMREDVEELHWHGPFRERAQKIEAAAERCARVVRSFLTIARQRKAEKRAIEIVPLVEGAIDLLAYNLRSGGIEVERDYEESLPAVFVDGDQVQQIVVNLVVNAAQALEQKPDRRLIRVSLRQGSDQSVRVVIADNGPGVSAELATRIFDPFFTTKPQGMGTGIGLSVSRGLAQAQGGRLTLDQSPSGGAAFELVLPVAQGRPAEAADSGPGEARRESAVALGDSSRRAIVIDDETEIAVLLGEILHNAGYVCDVATSGREGQAMIASRAGGYDAVVCDLRMPDMDGPQLFAWMEAAHPALAERTLFVTGDTLGPTAAKFLARCNRPVLEKPFSPTDVVRLVREFTPRTGIA